MNSRNMLVLTSPDCRVTSTRCCDIACIGECLLEHHKDRLTFDRVRASIMGASIAHT